jgi:hypothetical protein
MLRLEICCWVNFLPLAPRLEVETVAAGVSHGLLTCLHRSQTHCESTNEPQSLSVLWQTWFWQRVQARISEAGRRVPQW